MLYTGSFYDRLMCRKDIFYRTLRGINNDVVHFVLTVLTDCWDISSVLHEYM